MSSSSRDTIPTTRLSPLKTRKRATTRALLGDEYPTDVTQTVEPPKPLPQSSDYDQTRFKAGLIFAEIILRNPTRRLSPVGEQCLRIYKDACARLLDMDEEGEVYDENTKTVEMVRNEWIADVRGYEREIQFLACLKTTNMETAQELQDELVRLKRNVFYARYGDIFGEICKQLKRKAENGQVVGWKTLQTKYWTSIQKEIDSEKKAYLRVLDGKDCHSECPTHMAIFYACQRVGFTMDDMLAVIEQYAIRNNLLHSNFIPLVKDGKFDTLKTILNNDLCDIPGVVYAAENISANILKSIIITMIKQWFTLPEPEDITNTEAWIPSHTLLEYRKKLRGESTISEADLAKRVTKSVIQGIRQRRKELRERELVKELRTFKLAEPKRIKRVASSNLEVEKERAKKQKKDWARLTNLAYRIQELSQEYINSYGELEVPAELVEDL
jgi:hypothetical protein